MKNYPADGISQGKVVLEKSIFALNDEIEPLSKKEEMSIKIIKKIREWKKETWYFKSTEIPGTVDFKTSNNNRLRLNFYSDSSDVDGDGFPDSSELRNSFDRKSFKEWFLRIANSQFLKKDEKWNKAERDCAGLIRYAYREALKKHDYKWQKKTGIVLDKNLSDIQEFHYPEIPVIKGNIFKISAGSWNDSSSFSSYADAEHLMKYNTRFISRNFQDSEPGDILFFFDEKNPVSPYHSMIVVETRQEDMVLYHTGGKAGIKRIPVSDLDVTSKFQVNPNNKNFIGVFRFHIID